MNFSSREPGWAPGKTQRNSSFVLQLGPELGPGLQRGQLREEAADGGRVEEIPF